MSEIGSTKMLSLNKTHTLEWQNIAHA